MKKSWEDKPFDDHLLYVVDGELLNHMIKIMKAFKSSPELPPAYNKVLNYYNPLKIYKKRFRDISKFYYYGKYFFKKLPSHEFFIKKNQEINQIRNYLLEYTKNNLTSEKLAEYVINTSNIFFK